MKTLMLTAFAITASLACFGAPNDSAQGNYNPSGLPEGLSEPAVTPGEINYQGVLRNPKDGAFYKDGIYDLECRLYTRESGGTPIWGASYSVYVKNGYFNAMLGNAGGTELGYEFKKNELWKALWFAPGNRDLYLGVTPRQDANRAAISSPAEIKPRQKLLTAPFAFRAQKARFADEAAGDFKVEGDLNVGGNVTVSSGKSLTLSNITASDSEVKIGTSKSSPSKATLQGSTVLVEAGTALNVNSHGDARVTMDSGKVLVVAGGDFGVNNQSVTLRSSSSAYVDGGQSLMLKADQVRGAGPLVWNVNGRNDPYISNLKAPIVMRKVKVNISGSGDVLGNQSLKECPELADVSTDNYAWSVAGFQAVIGVVHIIQATRSPNSTIMYHLGNVPKEHVGYFFVDVMGISKWWTDDTRGN